MARFKVTAATRDYSVYYVDAPNWQEAKRRVDEADDVAVDHTDVGEEQEVVFVDTEDGTHSFYECGIHADPETEGA